MELVQTIVKGIVRSFVDGCVDNDKKVPNSWLECEKHTLFKAKMAKFDTHFLLKQ